MFAEIPPRVARNPEHRGCPGLPLDRLGVSGPGCTALLGLARGFPVQHEAVAGHGPGQGQRRADLPEDVVTDLAHHGGQLLAHHTLPQAGARQRKAQRRGNGHEQQQACHHAGHELVPYGQIAKRTHGNPPDRPQASNCSNKGAASSHARAPPASGSSSACTLDKYESACGGSFKAAAGNIQTLLESLCCMHRPLSI